MSLVIDFHHRWLGSSSEAEASQIGGCRGSGKDCYLTCVHSCIITYISSEAEIRDRASRCSKGHWFHWDGGLLPPSLIFVVISRTELKATFPLVPSLRFQVACLQCLYIGQKMNKKLFSRGGSRHSDRMYPWILYLFNHDNSSTLLCLVRRVKLSKKTLNSSVNFKYTASSVLHKVS